jgi:hypothetical protein
MVKLATRYFQKLLDRKYSQKLQEETKNNPKAQRRTTKK